MADRPVYRWDIVVPAHRYVFAVSNGEIEEFNEPGDEPGDRFKRYQAIKADHPVHGMIAWPNTVLLRGPVTAIVDPGLVTQGSPLLLGLERLGVEPESVDLVINTHHHVDHTHANAYFPGATGVIHRHEYYQYTSDYRLGYEPPNLRLLEGQWGDIAPGLRFALTPGHTVGSICVVAKVAEGNLVVAGDTVGPLPEYFDKMKLPDGFPNRHEIIQSWWRIRDFEPDIIIPGHNPPMAFA